MVECQKKEEIVEYIIFGCIVLFLLIAIILLIYIRKKKQLREINAHLVE